jgi:hypothetical protein
MQVKVSQIELDRLQKGRDRGKQGGVEVKEHEKGAVPAPAQSIKKGVKSVGSGPATGTNTKLFSKIASAIVAGRSKSKGPMPAAC